jgi:hypothetical protein
MRCNGATYAWAGILVLRSWRVSGESRWSKGEEGKALMAVVMRVRAEESLRVERVLVRVRGEE